MIQRIDGVRPSPMRRGLVRGAVVAVLSAILLLAAADGADARKPRGPDFVPKKQRCRPNQVTMIQTKVCKATKRRPAVTVKRACCTKPNGKRRCKSFPKCPRRSPS